MDNRMMQAMIFAAGLGTRLKPLTDHVPKALVNVAGSPLLKHVICRMKDAGFQRIVVNVHHFSKQITDYLEANHNFGMNICISDETDHLLDTGGGLKAAKPFFDRAPILVHNVDILSNVDLKDFYESNLQAAATLLVSERQTKRYLLFDNDMRLVGWTNIETGEVKSPFLNIDPSNCQKFAFSGIHIFSPCLFPLMESYPDCFGIIDFYLHICADVPIKGRVGKNLQLMDVGKLNTLHEADDFVKQLHLE